jgi:hypothetical protein
MAAVADGPDDDFIGTLIPLPEEIKAISTGSCEIDGERVTKWREIDGKNVKISELDIQHITDLHGTADWYAWTSTHWGTKWGAYECTIDYDAKSIHFNSAWSPPLPAIETISAMFPHARFTIAYAEGGSCYYGTAVFDAGHCVAREESEDFWKPDMLDDEGADIYDSLTDECRAHIEDNGLHTGG